MLFIAIYAAGMPFNQDTIAKGESLGGSESAAYYVAMELAKLDNRVIVFTSHREGGQIDNVTFQYHGDLTEQAPLGDMFMQYAANAPIDALVVQRHPAAFQLPIKGKLNLWWLHDLALARNTPHVNQSLINIDKVLAVSEFHRCQVSEVYDIPIDSVHATANGIDLDLYPKDKVLPLDKREPRTLLYSSRPERGLINLVGEGGIMEDLKDCHLYVCGYDNTVPQMEGLYRYLWQRCEELPNVTNLGPLSKVELSNLQRRVTLYVYPSEFEETSCITAMESQAAGTPFIGSRCGALAETLKDGGARLVRVGKDGKFNRQKFISTVRRVLNDESEWQNLHKKALSMEFGWAVVAEDWVNLIETELAKKCDDKARLSKHLEHNSDIIALCHLHEIEAFIGTCWPVNDLGDDPDIVNKIESAHPGLWNNYQFLFTGDFAGHYERYYKYEADRGVDYGPEDLNNDQRFETTVELIDKLVNGLPTGARLRVLDYGCAHGHYVMNLLNRFPGKLDIVGLDLVATNIEKAQAWYDDSVKHGCEDPARFIHGDDTVLSELHGQMDLVIASEVLEHVPDVASVVDALRACLVTGGMMLISTPFGPWEAVGYDWHPGWRAHIHHFERVDLFELFGAFKDYSVIMLPNIQNFGNFVITFKPDPDIAVGKIDYDRKLRTQNPRETLSATMIIKDGEHKIGRTIEKLKGLYDELVMGIDETTTDETLRVAESFGAKIVHIASPTEQGFDAARNQVIKQATCDWILWIDDDETLESGEAIKSKYLRSNCYTAYSVPQHHFAQQPAGLFQTDFPTRLFRNRKGIQFFGHVHEHPELALNKGIGKVAVLGDVGIMHTGYATEAIRRQRFERNWPLIQVDRKKYPDRVLGRFLWMRDLSHVIMYQVELQQRGAPQMNVPPLEQLATEIIGHWRWLVDNNHMRMVKDGLPFYTNAVQVLTNNQGIQFEVNLSASKLNGGPNMSGVPCKGQFIEQSDITRFMVALTKEATDVFAKKYF